MKNWISILAVIASTAVQADAQTLSSKTTQALTAVRVSAPSHQRLSSVKSIFVAPLGSGEGSELIRQKVINRLIEGGTLTVVDSADDADAILKGAAEMDRHSYLMMNNGFASSGTKYHAEGVVRLVSNNKQILWSDDIASRKFFPSHSAKGVSSNVSDKIVNALMQAISADRIQVAGQEPNRL